MNKCMYLHIGPDNSKKAKEQTTKPATDAAPPPKEGKKKKQWWVKELDLCVREGTAT